MIFNKYYVFETLHGQIVLFMAQLILKITGKISKLLKLEGLNEIFDI
jgi:hypothetical protein